MIQIQVVIVEAWKVLGEDGGHSTMKTLKSMMKDRVLSGFWSSLSMSLSRDKKDITQREDLSIDGFHDSE